MSNNKRPANPLLGVSHFKLEDSFGVQPTLVVPPASSTASTSATSVSSPNSTQFFNASGQQPPGPDPFSEVNLNSNSPLKPPPVTPGPPPVQAIMPGPPPVMSIGPPQPGLFLLPSSTSSTPGKSKSNSFLYFSQSYDEIICSVCPSVQGNFYPIMLLVILGHIRSLKSLIVSFFNNISFIKS